VKYVGRFDQPATRVSIRGPFNFVNDSTVLSKTKFIISPIAMTLPKVGHGKTIGQNLGIDELDVPIVIGAKRSNC